MSSSPAPSDRDTHVAAQRRWPWHRWTLDELVALMHDDLGFKSLGRWQRSRAFRALGRLSARTVLRAYYGRET